MISLRDIPNDLQFSEMKTDERVAGENTVSIYCGIIKYDKILRLNHKIKYIH